MMKRSLLKMLLLVLPFWSQAQVVLENFESAAKLPWNPIEGSFAVVENPVGGDILGICLLYTSPSPRDRQKSRMPSSA